MALTTTDRLLGRRPRGSLYHYTTIEGLAGVLSSGAIWATHIKYLNDRSEFAHGVEFARRFVRWRRSRASPKSQKFLDGVLEAMQFKGGADQFFGVHVSSFCECPDELSLWRAYARTGGFSIGYDWRLDDRAEIILAKCIYRDELKRRIIEDLLDEFGSKDGESVLQDFSRLGHTVTPGTTVDQARGIACVLRFIMFSPALKDASFRDEREWRTIVLPNIPYEPFLRAADIPTIAVPLVRGSDLVIDEIVVGPGPDLKQRRAAVEELLARRHPHRVTCRSIRESRVPLR